MGKCPYLCFLPSFELSYISQRLCIISLKSFSLAFWAVSSHSAPSSRYPFLAQHLMFLPFLLCSYILAFKSSINLSALWILAQLSTYQDSIYIIRSFNSVCVITKACFVLYFHITSFYLFCAAPSSFCFELLKFNILLSKSWAFNACMSRKAFRLLLFLVLFILRLSQYFVALFGAIIVFTVSALLNHCNIIVS